MQQRSVRHTSDISKQVAELGQGLQAFSQRLEQDVAEIKRAVGNKPRPGRAHPLPLQSVCVYVCHTTSVSVDDPPALTPNPTQCRCTDAALLARHGAKSLCHRPGDQLARRGHHRCHISQGMQSGCIQACFHANVSPSLHAKFFGHRNWLDTAYSCFKRTRLELADLRTTYNSMAIDLKKASAHLTIH